MKNKATVRTVGVKTVYFGKILDVERHDLDFGNGKFSGFEVVQFKVVTGVSALPVTGNGVLLIRHYQAGLQRTSWSLPTGGLNRGENPVQRMQWELEEEIGYRAGRLTLMLRSHPMPGYIGTEAGYIFLAEDLNPSKRVGDEHYSIEVAALSWKEVNALVDRGEIIDTRTLLAILWYQAKIKKKK